jgi:4a-hydroxytetrahydrobiopterin dehydratase
MERKLLTADAVDSALTGLNGWTSADGSLVRRFEFTNFAAALAFVNAVGEIAERLDHHPDITFGWGYAEIRTTTHDRGGITPFDVELARLINGLI